MTNLEKSYRRRLHTFQQFEQLPLDRRLEVAGKLSERLGPSSPSSAKMLHLSLQEQVVVAIAVDLFVLSLCQEDSSQPELAASCDHQSSDGE